MSEIKTVFCDVGGVLLSDGWDHVSRRAAAENFGIDWHVFENHHAPLAEALDTGKISFAEYLEQTIFYQPRDFSADQFMEFVKSQSKILDSTFHIIAQVAASGRFRMCILSNESPELTDYRIKTFKLSHYFECFFSSGYLGMRKPDRAIYDCALKVANTQAEESVFIDDRKENLTVPRQLGMHTVHCTDANSLMDNLALLGIWNLSLAQ